MEELGECCGKYSLGEWRRDGKKERGGIQRNIMGFVHKEKENIEGEKTLVRVHERKRF